MTFLVLLAPAAVLGLFWAMQRMETWMHRTARPSPAIRGRQVATTAPQPPAPPTAPALRR